MKVLVSGGAGFIGSHLVDKLIAQRHKVVVIDNLSTGKKKNVNPKAKFIKMDIRSSRLPQAFGRPDVVFHLAALPRVPLSVKDPVGTTDVNITGTVNVFEAARKAGAKRVVFASSSSVYGTQKKLPLKETMIPNPQSPYGVQKLAGEQFAKLFGDLYKFPVVCLRYFNVYGPRLDFDSDYSLVLGKFLKFLFQGKGLTVFGDGKQTRSFCYVDDVVQATLKAATAKNIEGGEVVNVGGRESRSVNDIVAMLGGKPVFLPSRPGDVRHTKADMKLAQRLLGWEPKISFPEGLAKTKAWFLDLPAKA